MDERRRVDRVSVLIQRELSEAIQRELKDPRVRFCTVSQVEVSPDLRYADVKVSVVGDKKRKRDSIAGLRSAAGFLRRVVAKRIGLRHATELRFELDNSVDQLMQIDRLLKQAGAQEERLGRDSGSDDEVIETI
ncbi:MAG: 30S ribosome-binding factor RbfA [Candidatus Poribacteria bacterium]|nr:30S ribosome-binding factor RbfA [Candidatus Poribacteria bacterium]